MVMKHYNNYLFTNKAFLGCSVNNSSDNHHYKWYLWNVLHSNTEAKKAPMCAAGFFHDEFPDRNIGYSWQERQRLLVKKRKLAPTPVYHGREVALTAPFYSDMICQEAGIPPNCTIVSFRFVDCYFS